MYEERLSFDISFNFYRSYNLNKSEQQQHCLV